MIIDLSHVQDIEGTFDLVIEDGDLATSAGLESPLVVSLFTDRRAYSDEGVPDPLRRRGWLGSTLLPAPDANFGSGLWFYEQARASREVAIGIRSEAESALQWMADENIVDTAVASVVADPAARAMRLIIDLTSPAGEVTRTAYTIAEATEAGILRAQ